VEQENGDSTAKVENGQGDHHVTPRTSAIPMNAQAPVNATGEDDGGVSNITIADSLNGIAGQSNSTPQTPERRPEPPTSSVTQPVTINVSGANEYSGLSPLYQSNHDSLMPDRVHDGPMTPRNDAGPFVLDGSAGRASGSRLRDASPDSDSGSTNSGTPSLPNGISQSGAPTLPPVRFD
jgi:hypothetical protein